MAPVVEDGAMAAGFSVLPAHEDGDNAAHLRRFQASLAEAQKLHRQCRDAAAASAERQHPVQHRIERFQEHVASAKAVSGFAGKFTAQAAELDQDVPHELGHLCVPAPTVTLSAQAATVTLPGQVEGDDLQSSASPHCRDAGAVEASSQTKQPCANPAGADSTSPSSAQARDTPHETVGKSADAKIAIAAVATNSANGALPTQLRHASDVSSVGTRKQAAVQNPQGRSSANQEGSDDSSGFSSDSSSESSVDGWPPKAPIMRFKHILHFSCKFRNKEEHSRLLREHNEKQAMLSGRIPNSAALRDPTVTWINTTFKMCLSEEGELDVGFPVVALTILDAIYPNRVVWRAVDWNFQYKRAWAKNYAMLEKVWNQVNMDKARGFRVGDTRLRLDTMPASNLKDKVEFLRLMRNWFDSRIHHSAPYDPIVRRSEIIKTCEQRGFTVVFPRWMDYEKGEPFQSSRQLSFAQRANACMPEFKRLIWFLGTRDPVNL